MQLIQTFFFVIVPILGGVAMFIKLVLHILNGYEHDPLAFWYSSKSLLKNTCSKKLKGFRKLQNKLSFAMVVAAIVYFITYGMYCLINN